MEKTEVMIGRKGDDKPMIFRFDEPMQAYIFYCEAKDNYAEDDMVIEMW
jgi:hypothetical protein